MIKKTFLGLGPMSLEIIDSLNYFSKKYKKKNNAYFFEK